MKKRKISLFALFAVLFSASLFVTVSFAKTADGESYKTLSYKPLPSLEEIVSLPEYDGRDYGIITPVKDQGSTNLCWAYSSIAASEASIVRSGLKPLDEVNLNPTAAAYRVNNRAGDPLGNTSGNYVSGDFTTFTGNPSKIATIFSGWWGPVSGANATVDPFENSEFRLENAVHIPENKNDPALRIAEIKKAIAKYGAVTFQYNNRNNIYYYNPKNEKGGSSYPHACAIVGWNDNIPAENFAPDGATMNGGWLIKNSYSSLPSGYPYFYISYDNTSSSMYAFSYVERKAYDRNYYYDGDIDDFPLRNDKHVANVYRAGSEVSGKTEKITAVNVGVEGNGYTLEAEIYTGLSSPFESENAPVAGGKSVAKKTMSFDYGGYVTMRLDEPVSLSAGEWFSVVVRVVEGNAKIRLGVKNSKTLSYAGSYGNYVKFENYVGRIKAFTTFYETETHAHSLKKIEKRDATCVADGNIEYYVCESCGKLFSDGEGVNEITAADTIVAARHSLRKIEKRDATCVADGNIEYYVCESCGKLFSDGEGIKEINYSETVIPKGHSFGEWIDEIPPDSERDGVKGHRDCLICGKHFDRENNEITDLTIKKDQESSSETESGSDKTEESESEDGSQSESMADTDAPQESESDLPNSEGEDNIGSASSESKSGEESSSSDEQSGNSVSSGEQSSNSVSSGNNGGEDKNESSCMSALSAGATLFNAVIIIAAVCLLIKKRRQ